MTFKEIIDLTKNRIDTVEQGDFDEQIESIVTNAINHCYLFELSKLEPDMNKAYLPSVNGLVSLPDDIDEIISIYPELEPGERRIGKNIVTDREETFELLYTMVNEPLINDNDEPNISKKYHYLLSTYACYSYFTYRKKTDIASMYLNEYMLQLNKTKEDNFGSYGIKDVTGW